MAKDVYQTVCIHRTPSGDRFVSYTREGADTLLDDNGIPTAGLPPEVRDRLAGVWLTSWAERHPEHVGPVTAELLAR